MKNRKTITLKNIAIGVVCGLGIALLSIPGTFVQAKNGVRTAVAIFDVCLQDDYNPVIQLTFSSTTGNYLFCCNGTTLTRIGKVTVKGGVISLIDSQTDRRIRAEINKATRRGNASLQNPDGTLKCTIVDRNTANDTCTCNNAG